MTGTAAVPSLETQDSEALRAALAAGDGAHHETALGGFVVEGEARRARLMLCHGAGAGHDSPFLVRLRQQLATRGIQVVALEFDYMATMRKEGKRRPPPRIERLVAELAEWRRALLALDGETPLWVGGKSMGGRVASLLATQVEVAGLVLCGYPFHPPGKPARLRLDHWPEIRCPLLLLQGTRDPFGRHDEVEGYDLPAQTECHFLEGGDHDWKPPKRHAQTQSTLIDEAVGHVARRLSASE
ncbi:alpha/beta fold hydrolase [Salinicola salarius]|uniref:alpha/beta family hydrolase n=1 Tax=Salinicola salarius TaxID=430457 RepID=UPI0023E36279|nr:alpha/beta family hydrolase [Salinicola salarius]MDF3918357.1 alpha/beta fold hydrolase [Salinicola salarius]